MCDSIRRVILLFPVAFLSVTLLWAQSTPVTGSFYAHTGNNPGDTLTEFRFSEKKFFKASVSCEIGRPPLNKIHTWVLRIQDPEGKVIADADRIDIAGGMPDHGHGFPTTPAVTRSFGDGTYLVEGVRFNMSGKWMMIFTVYWNNKMDKVLFELNIPD